MCMFDEYPYKNAVENYMTRHDCDGKLYKIEQKDYKTLLYTFATEEYGPWVLTLQRTSHAGYIRLNDEIYRAIDMTQWEHLCIL